MLLLKGVGTNLHTDRLACSKFPCWGRGMKVARDIRREIELSNYRAEAEGAAFPRQKCWQRAVFLC